MSIEITLTSHGAAVAATSNEISFDPELVSPDGSSPCELGPAAVAAGKDQLLVGSSPGLLTVGVISFSNFDPIGDGVVAVCRFVIAPDAPAGPIVLGNTPGGSDPDGNELEMDGRDGTITVRIPLPELNLGEATGAPGETVSIEITLRSRGAQVAATSNDISFDPALVSPDGSSPCELGPAAVAAGKDQLLVGSSPGLLTVGVISFSNFDPIGDGVVAVCRFVIAPDAPAGTIVLGNTPGGSDPDGNELEMDGRDGRIDVVL